MRSFILLFAFFGLPSFAFSNLYFSRMDGNWNDPNNWSTTSGGPSANIIPSPSDNVVIEHIVTLSGTGSYTHTGEILLRNEGQLISTQQFIYAGKTFTINPNSIFEIDAPGVSPALTIESLTTDGLIPTIANYAGQIIVDNGDASTSILNNGSLRILNEGSLITSSDIINANEVLINPYTTFKVGGIANVTPPINADFIAQSGSTTTVRGDLRVEDDLIIYGTTASMICGDGRIIMGAAQDNLIVYQDGENGQICSELPIVRDPDPLPIDILSFVVHGNSLIWDVFEERIIGYEIQLSQNAEDWSLVGARESQGDGRHHYSFNITKSGYYRLKILDVEGVKLTSIVYYSGLNDLNFYPNAVDSGNQITFTGEKLIEGIEVVHPDGSVDRLGKPQDGTLKINHNPGVYLVKILGNKTIKISRLIVK